MSAITILSFSAGHQARKQAKYAKWIQSGSACGEIEV